MSNTKHTPGPWTAIITTDGTHEVTTSDGIYPQTVARMYSTGKLMQSQAPANAAPDRKCAAPDLLAALSRVSEFLEANYGTADMPDILPVVRVALAKAGVQS
jgi:hypothetical protein